MSTEEDVCKCVDKLALESEVDSDSAADEMPIAIERRVSAVKKLFIDMVITMQMLDTSDPLSPELVPLFAPNYEKRRRIVSGEYEPMDSDLFPEDRVPAVATDIIGIPDFWLNVLMATAFKELISEYDEPILQHLIDIKELMTNKETQKENIIEFYFAPNEYFENKVLIKKLLIISDIDEECQVNCRFRAIKCESTPIEWKKGKDSAVSDLSSKPSFFQFFWSSGEPLDETQEKRLVDDWKLCEQLCSDWIVSAVYYYTGEADVLNILNESLMCDHNDDEDEDNSQEGDNS